MGPRRAHLARHRIDHDIPDEVAGLALEPPHDQGRGAWRHADRTVNEVHDRLGLDRGRNRGAGLER